MESAVETPVTSPIARKSNLLLITFGTIFVIFIAIVTFAVVSNLNKQAPVDNEKTLAQSCSENGGRWLEESQECEGISVISCNSLNGEYNECASACRNEEDADIACTLQCVHVCSFANSAEDSTSISIDINSGTASSDSYQIEYIIDETAFELLTRLDQNESTFSFEYQDYGGELGAAPTSFNGIEADSSSQFWEFFVNGESSLFGISTYKVQQGDKLSFKLTSFN